MHNSAKYKSFYLSEITRIKESCFSNEHQLKTIIATRNYITTNFDKDLNLVLLSKVLFTSKFHLIRLFKQYYGQTPRQYLIDVRVEKAKTLLKEGQNVSDTTFNVGFESPSSFSTLFKSRTGLSPTEYQKKAIFAKSL